MFKRVMFGLTAMAGLGLMASAPSAVQAEDLRIASWGGITSDANREAYWKPFEAETGIHIQEDSFNGEIGKIRAQVQSGSLQWDIAEPEFAEVEIGCMEGLYEPIDTTMLPMDDIPAQHVTECGVTSLLAGTLLVYDRTRYGDDGPKTWSDFWDVEKFPGKRAMNRSVKASLVFALLADGVQLDQIYEVLGTKEGQDRAFAKLDEIKDDLVWWASGTESIQGFASDAYDMAAVWNGRAAGANETQNQDLELVWDAGWISNGNRWVILKGSPNYDAAMKFIAFATQPEPQAEFMRQINYGSVNQKSFDLLDPERLKDMPGAKAYAPYEIFEDAEFWLVHLDSLTERFNNWVAQ